MTDTRTANLTYAAGDVVAYCATLGTAPPAGPASVTPLVAPWICLGWIDTGGHIFKLSETLKSIMAAGTLDPIRTVFQSAEKTFDLTFQEGFNPMVRALYDDVPLSLLQPGPSSTIATYVYPEVPSGLRYAFVFDTLDADKETRLFAPQGQITNRGQDQQQQGDIEPLQMTITLYPDLINGTRSALQRCVNYGATDTSAFFG